MTQQSAKQSRGVEAIGERLAANVWRPRGTEGESPITITLHGDWILVVKCFVPDADDGEGLIIIPERSKDKTVVCSVEAVGPDCRVFHPEHCGRTYVKASGNLMGANNQFYLPFDPTRATWLIKESVFIEGKAGAIPLIWVEDDEEDAAG